MDQAVPPRSGQSDVSPADLIANDASALAAKVRAGAITATELTQATLDNIATLEPAVNAFRIVMSDHALENAARIDGLSAKERRALPLAGVPIAIKDDTDVAGQSTMWGTAIERGVCSADAEIVQRLRNAGAIVIGKTNVPELTLWPWTASKTWGTTHNPWNMRRSPGGSSGGSAAAVCSGMAALALGSDGGGSVRYPAALTALIGLKPQRDRLPLGPEHGSGWHGLIALGPLTRSVRDAALFLDVTSKADTRTEFRDAVEEAAGSLAIGVAVDPPPGSQVSLTSAGRATIDDATELLGALGHDIVDVDVDYGLAAIRNSTIRFLRGAHDDIASLPDHSQLERRTRAVHRLGKLIPKRSLARALERESDISASMNEVFNSVDVIMTPLCQSPAPTLEKCPERGAMRSLRAANTSAWLVPWNLTGQPAISVPMGLDDAGLPTAVHLVGRAGDEATLLALAAGIEQQRPFPKLPPSSTE